MNKLEILRESLKEVRLKLNKDAFELQEKLKDKECMKNKTEREAAEMVSKYAYTQGGLSIVDSIIASTKMLEKLDE